MISTPAFLLPLTLCKYYSVYLDALGVNQKANEKPLHLDYNLNVSSVFEPTHDRSILLAKNQNPQTKKETFVSFVEFVKNADVLNVVFGKGGKAIVILNSEIGINMLQ
jgi:hypothetical protein